MSEDVKPIWTREEIPLGVELFGSAGTARLRMLDAWKIRGIW